jgi:ribonuclease HII
MTKMLIGIDEAGMGTLAGPVVASVVAIPEDQIPPGVRDSKKLTKDCREEVAALIMERAFAYKTATRSPDLIDKFGLSACWKGAIVELAIFIKAARELHGFPEAKIILDGNRLIPGHPYVVPVVKADVTHPAVSAASILAKYTQCCWMEDYHIEYPRYGFDRHNGYGTQEHITRLKELGPCPIHRRSFKPVKCAAHSLECGSRQLWE